MCSTLQSLRARRGQTEKGFTLIELLVVVVIIGVLIAIAIPLYLNYQKSSHDKAADSDVRNAVIVMEQCYADNGVYPDTTGGTYSTTTTTVDLSAGSVKCDGKINLSPGTVLKIKVTAATSSAPASYQVTGYNSDGHANTYFNYSSTSGGSVQKSGTATLT
jgi:type IV pilus assembly protein PilA